MAYLAPGSPLYTGVNSALAFDVSEVNGQIVAVEVAMLNTSQ